MRKLPVLFLVIILLVIAGCTNKEDIEAAAAKERETFVLSATQDFQSLIDAEDYVGVRDAIKSETDMELLGAYDVMVGEHVTWLNQSINSEILDRTMDFDVAMTRLSDFAKTEQDNPDFLKVKQLINSLEASSAAYMLGMQAYADRDFTTAIKQFVNVIPLDIDYDNAKLLLDETNARINSWILNEENNIYGRTPYGLAYKDGYSYIAHKQDDIVMIVKSNDDFSVVLSFPIIKMKGIYNITGINVVGDYIYFIAGEDVGRGYVVDAPYNIYEMKTDGSGLICVLEGDFSDLISLGDTFYALSHTKGLISIDNSFSEITQISDSDVISMYPFNGGINYTVRDSIKYNADYVLYSYDGREHVELDRKRLLHAYYYGDMTIYYHDVSAAHEKIFIDNFDTQKAETVAQIDVNGFFGRIDNYVIYSHSGKYDQERYTVYDIKEKENISIIDHKEVADYYVKGLLNETSTVVVEKLDGLYYTDVTFEDIRRIDLPTVDKQVLNNNSSKLVMIAEEDLYTPEEFIYIKDNYWHYSIDDLNITIEREFAEDADCFIYTTHVKTTDPRKLTIGYIGDPPGYKTRADPIHAALYNNTVFAQNGDYWCEPSNSWTGIVIRQGEVFRKTLKKDMVAIYPDGSIKCYEAGDDVDVEQLLAAGVEDTMSFGPVMLSEGEFGSFVTEHPLRLRNPRSAIGMVEPGHYVFIASDGRQANNRGLTFQRLAEEFLSEGCVEAYNFDGGQSTAVMFMGNYLNNHDNDSNWQGFRYVSEVVFMGQSENTPADLSEYVVD